MNFMKLSKNKTLPWKKICIFGYLHYLKHLNEYITIHLINISILYLNCLIIYFLPSWTILHLFIFQKERRTILCLIFSSVNRVQ